MSVQGLPPPPRRRGEGAGAPRCARAARAGRQLVFDVFAPAADDIEETHGRWLEREPGIFERADWDEEARTLTLSVRGASGATTFTLAWISPDEWRELIVRAGFDVEACYGWFDNRPYAGGEDQIWVARRPAELDQVDGVADGDFAGLDDPREHPALAVELRLEPGTQVVHPLARIADHGDLEDGVAARARAGRSATRARRRPRR